MNAEFTVAFAVIVSRNQAKIGSVFPPSNCPEPNSGLTFSQIKPVWILASWRLVSRIVGNFGEAGYDAVGQVASRLRIAAIASAKHRAAAYERAEDVGCAFFLAS